MESIKALTNIVYILSAITFILGFKMMSNPASAKRGNIYSAVGMGAAIIVTMMQPDLRIGSNMLFLGIFGSVIGGWLAYKTPMTGMPQMVGLLNGFGGLASWLVGAGEFLDHPNQTGANGLILAFTVIVGALTFTGSVVAWAKLEEKFISGKPIQFGAQKIVMTAVLAGLVLACGFFARDSGGNDGAMWFWLLSTLGFLLGVLLVIPIGGADMPVVICLMNSYSGVAACASGFVLNNTLLIVAGALVGASGIILTLIMCKAMNRSVANVFLGGFGAVTASAGADVVGEIKPATSDAVYSMLEAAQSVVIVPGYGMAVSQAQHTVRELMHELEKNGTEVRFAIHPVAGRMPGHMNVLLAEANISYDSMIEMDQINSTIETVDVVMIIGANDVVNPAAREDKSSPLYGMPIINADYARTVIVMKRSMGKGFAGVENPLFFKSNTRMYFGDAKASLQALVNEFKGS
jgi:H+-translocating NAD(P) transhydrogenase subunit beta